MKITKSQLKQIIKEELDSVLNELEGDELRRYIEKDLGLPPGSIKSSEELKQAEKERKEKAKSKPQTKSSKAAKRRPKYGHGGTHETWH